METLREGIGSESGLNSRLRFVGNVAAAFQLAVVLACGSATAQESTTRPIRMLVPYPAGGAADFLARLVGAKAGAYLKQTFVVENRPGANGIIAVHTVVNAPADGHTVLFAVPGVVIFNSHK